MVGGFRVAQIEFKTMTNSVEEATARGAQGRQSLERHLVMRAKLGDEDAFRQLFDLHKRRIYLLCLRITNHQAEAEDLCRDAFLLLFRKLDSFRGDSGLSTWLNRLVVNLALTRRRRKAPSKIRLEEWNRLSGRSSQRVVVQALGV